MLIATEAAQLLEAGADRLEGRADLARRAQIEPHAVHLGLVGDAPRAELDHHRIAQRLGVPHRLAWVLRGQRLHGGDAVGREDLLRFDLVEERTALAARGIGDSGGDSAGAGSGVAHPMARRVR